MDTSKVVIEIKYAWYFKILLEVLPFFVVCNFFSYCTARELMQFVGRNGGIKINNKNITG